MATLSTSEIDQIIRQQFLSLAKSTPPKIIEKEITAVKKRAAAYGATQREREDMLIWLAKTASWGLRLKSLAKETNIPKSALQLAFKIRRTEKRLNTELTPEQIDSIRKWRSKDGKIVRVLASKESIQRALEVIDKEDKRE